MSDQSPTALAYQRARFNTRLPLDYLYTASHFWIGPAPETQWRVGLTAFGSRLLGEVVDYGFETAADAQVRSGQIVGWIEGFKALCEIPSLADGSFAGANPRLEQTVTAVNQDPCGSGWLYAVRGAPAGSLLTVRDYAKTLDQLIDRLWTGQ